MVKFTRFIYPLVLREKVGYRIQKFYPDINDRNISLEFDKQVKLDLSKYDVAHRAIIFNGFYELDLSKSLLKLAGKGGLLIDVGANYGYYACLWASKNAQNRVLAFEASPLNIEPLKHNVEKNGLQDQIDIIPVALGKENGKLNFTLQNKNGQTGWGGLTLNNNEQLVEVEVDTLDNYVYKYNIDEIDVLKIDTEGADAWVLYGAKNLLARKKIRHIFFEKNVERMKLLNIGISDAKSFLEDLGYKAEEKSATEIYSYPK